MVRYSCPPRSPKEERQRFEFARWMDVYWAQRQAWWERMEYETRCYAAEMREYVTSCPAPRLRDHMIARAGRL